MQNVYIKLKKTRLHVQLYSHNQAYLQPLVKLYMLNGYGIWDPSREATDLHVKVKNTPHTVRI
jgi:hypothetical protein